MNAFKLSHVATWFVLEKNRPLGFLLQPSIIRFHVGKELFPESKCPDLTDLTKVKVLSQNSFRCLVFAPKKRTGRN